MKRKAKIILDEHGKVKIDLIGFSGKECENDKDIRELENLLLSKTNEKKKPEYYKKKKSVLTVST